MERTQLRYPEADFKRMGKVHILDDTDKITSSLQLDEPRPGIEEVEGAYDPLTDPQEKLIRKYGEYHPRNVRFWLFMIGALIISTLTAIAVYTGTTTDEYKNLKKPTLTPSPEVVIIGIAVFFVFISYVAYHMFKEKNKQIYRNGGIFMMIVLYAMVLWWTVVFFGQNTPSDASFILSLIIVLLIGWIALIIFTKNEDHDKVYLLVLGLLWFIYLFWFNLEIVNLNPTRAPEKIEKCDCFDGDRADDLSKLRRNQLV